MINQNIGLTIDLMAIISILVFGAAALAALAPGPDSFPENQQYNHRSNLL